MIVVSNNVQNNMPLDDDVVIRINVAWVKSKPELISIINENKNKRVYLDYPTGRTKPPAPTLSLAEAIEIANDNLNVEFFAVSNAEDFNLMSDLRYELHDRIKIVPKIESSNGVFNLLDVVAGAQTDVVMLDKEDLYSNVGHDSVLFTHLVEKIRTDAANENITILELQGVIFYAR